MVGHKTGSLPSPLILNIKFCKNFFIISIIYMRWPTNWDGEGKNRHCAKAWYGNANKEWNGLPITEPLMSTVSWKCGYRSLLG